MDHVQDYTTAVRSYFRSGTLQKTPKNTMLLSIEDAPKALYYIADGYVRIYSVNGRNEQYTHIIYGPGEIFPFTWILEYQRSNAVYETMTNAEIYCVPLDQAMADMQHNVQLCYGMLRQAVEQYRIYTMRVDNLEYKYASERLAYRLIMLANRFGERSGDQITIAPPLTHQLIGTTLNLSRESVSREMEKLVRRGLVRYNAERQIVILDIAALAKQFKVPLSQGLTAQRIGS